MPQEAFEEALNVELEYGKPVTRTSAADVDELSWDVTFPGGLYATYNKNGAQLPMAVSYRFSFRPVGSGSWIVALDTQAYENRKDAFRRGFRLPVARGQYEMMAERTSAKGLNVNSSAVETLLITAMRSSRNEYPLRFSKPIAVTAIRILASSQLNGAIDTLNGLVRSYVTSWNGAAWVGNTLSNNPADLFRHVLQSAPNARPVSDSRIDLAALQSWATYCRAKGFAYNKVIEQAASVTSLLDEICAAGRAVRVFTDGKWSVIWDRDDLPIVQHFSPRNSRDFSGSRQYRRMPHGFRVKFLNETKNFEQDERVVYDDGYTKANATLFEAIEFPGITNPDLIWKHGRFHIAQVRLRPELYKLTVDFENLVCTRGDRVRVTHDIPLWGQISARVTAVHGFEVTLDEWVAMEGDKNYVARFRLADGSSVLHNVAHIPGEHQTILLSADAVLPAVGDLMVGFGEIGRESVVLRILRIEPGADMTATVTMVDDAPEIGQADTGTIPIFDSQISAPVDVQALAPSDLVVSEELFTTGADIRAQARVSWRVQRTGFATSYEVQIRDDSVAHSDWRPLRTVPVPQAATDTGELAPGTYSFRVRALFVSLPPSAWQQRLNVVFQGLNAPPPDVTGFRISSLADLATLIWDQVTQLNLSHFEIRFSPLLDGVTWGSAGTIVPRASGTQVQIPNRVGTYLIKAVTRQDQFSATPAIITSTIAQLASVNEVEVITESPGFAGAKSGVEASGSFLQLAAPGGAMVESGTYTFAGSVDLGAVYTSRLTPTVDAFGASLDDVMASWATLVEVEALASADPSQWAVRVEYRMTNDNPALGNWSAWETLVITDLTARAFEFRAVLTGTITHAITPVVRGLSVDVDMPDRVEAGNDLLVTTSGLRIDFTPPFKSLRGVALAVQDRASGDREEITDKDETGFTLRFFNAAGGAVARTVDFVAKGYGRVEE
nr:host specificity factor TipJ family phage tail protein [Bosea sp. ASV33]